MRLKEERTKKRSLWSFSWEKTCSKTWSICKSASVIGWWPWKARKTSLFVPRTREAKTLCCHRRPGRSCKGHLTLFTMAALTLMSYLFSSKNLPQFRDVWFLANVTYRGFQIWTLSLFSKILASRTKSCSILVAYKGPNFWLNFLL